MIRKKIINDPVYGFISIRDGLLFELIQHPFFQRLRRIKQLGLTDFVYPGALHTRFHHALGAMHLMHTCMEVLRAKGQQISAEEHEAAMAAILLHDIGHGPFSHALENTILKKVHHEDMSLLLMEHLNSKLEGRLQLAIEMFTDRYHRRFFHQLVSSQLDMDRLDYLQRDCFFTGVIEGRVAFDRIIRMLDVVEDRIVVEHKGIYSIENFLNARRLMYWQVYMHKTTVSTEQMLTQLIRRAKKLTEMGEALPASPAFALFLQNSISFEELRDNRDYLEAFAALDDYDIWGCVKVWRYHGDIVLSQLSQMMLERRLFKVVLENDKIPKKRLKAVREQIVKHFGISQADAKFFCSAGSLTNSGYIPNDQNIIIKKNDGTLVDVAEASDLPNIKAISKIVKKYYLCHPKI